ncbi:MAG: sulfotransferase [Caulobacteraceae bacterium]
MPSRFSRVFVVTYGRSGSTLLQGLLNAIPGYRIFGENGGFLAKLHDAYEALVDAHRHLLNPANDTRSNPWYGSSRYDQATLTTAFHNFVERMLFRPGTEPEIRVFGFKEIKYNELGDEKLTSFLKFVRAIYPRSVIIFNTRRVQDVLKSGWWRSNFWKGLPKQLDDFETFAADYARLNSDHAIHVRYDALVSSDRREVARLLSFLNEELTGEQINSVFAGSHSYANRSLTGYLAGRAKHVELLDHDWWRANIDEFRIDMEPNAWGFLATGVIVRSADSSARLTLRSGTRVAEVVGAIATPKIEDLFANNPQSAMSGFSVELPAAPEVQLFGAADGAESRLIGVIRPGPALSGPGKAGG